MLVYDYINCGLSLTVGSFLTLPPRHCLQIDGPRTSAPPTDDEQVVIYHYVIKSAAEYKAKTARGSGDLGRKGPEFRRHIEAACTCECTQAQDMSRQLGYAWLAKRALDSLGLASEEELGPML